jgi:hypothetical protein
MPEIDEQPLRETRYENRDLTGVHINLPTLLWRAVGGLARYLGTSKTNIVLRALDNYLYLTKAIVAEDDARVAIVHGNGTMEYVPFPEVARTRSLEAAGH